MPSSRPRRLPPGLRPNRRIAILTLTHHDRPSLRWLAASPAAYDAPRAAEVYYYPGSREYAAAARDAVTVATSGEPAHSAFRALALAAAADLHGDAPGLPSLVLADWLDEHGRDAEADLIRSGRACTVTAGRVTLPDGRTPGTLAARVEFAAGDRRVASDGTWGRGVVAYASRLLGLPHDPAHLLGPDTTSRDKWYDSVTLCHGSCVALSEARNCPRGSLKNMKLVFESVTYCPNFSGGHHPVWRLYENPNSRHYLGFLVLTEAEAAALAVPS